jgi:hypothetical protein
LHEPPLCPLPEGEEATKKTDDCCEENVVDDTGGDRGGAADACEANKVSTTIRAIRVDSRVFAFNVTTSGHPKRVAENIL